MTPEEKSLKFIHDFICERERAAKIIEFAPWVSKWIEKLAEEFRQAEEEAYNRGLSSNIKEASEDEFTKAVEVLYGQAEKRGADSVIKELRAIYDSCACHIPEDQCDHCSVKVFQIVRKRGEK